jgi:hypothetical protein
MSVKDLPNYQEVLNCVGSIIKKSLAESDYTQLPDAPFSTEQKQAWSAYRQALRDLSTDANYPFVVLPTPPQAE